MNTRLDVFEQYRTTFSNSSRILDTLNCSKSYELLVYHQTVRTKWTTRTWSNYLILSNCSNQIGLFDRNRTIRYFSFLIIYLFNFNKNEWLFNEIILKIKIIFSYLLWNKYLSYKWNFNSTKFNVKNMSIKNNIIIKQILHKHNRKKQL